MTGVAYEEGVRHTEDEMTAMILLLLFAGHVTTFHLIGGGLFTLLQHPEQKQLLLADWAGNGFDSQPEFFPNMPLKPSMMWLIAACCRFLFQCRGRRIVVERLYPTQTRAANGISDMADSRRLVGFHFGMGWSPIWLALSNILILPFVVQIRKNTSIALVMHAIFRAVGFQSSALGLIK